MAEYTLGQHRRRALLHAAVHAKASTLVCGCMHQRELNEVGDVWIERMVYR